MIWLETALSGLALGAWRAFDGAGVYLPGGVRGIIGGLVIALIVYSGGWWSLGADWQDHLAAIALIAGVTYPLIRAADDWSDAELITEHFGFPIAVGSVPLTVALIFGPHPMAILIVAAFVIMSMISGLAYAFEAQLFDAWPMPKIGMIRFDDHRWAEFWNGCLIGAGLSAVTNWQVLIA